MRESPSNAVLRFAGGAVASVMIAAVSVYRWTASPILHALMGPGLGCRFSPSCSCYAAESLRHHGLVAGTALAFRRITKCHPFNSGGFDPVPVRNPQPRCVRLSS